MSIINTLLLMVHVLPQLPYAADALAPKMSKETIEYHYGKHHQAYVNNLNNLIPGTPYENMPLEEIIVKAESGPIYNNAAQVWNHTFFFFTLSPTPKSMPSGKLAEAINRDFGSFDAFKEQFTKAAAVEQRLQGLEASNARKLEEMRRTLAEGMTALQAQNAQKLDEIRH